jgi:hypothetical protein
VLVRHRPQHARRRAARLLAGDGPTLAATFEQAAALGVQWLGAGLDPDHLRAQAGPSQR